MQSHAAYRLTRALVDRESTGTIDRLILGGSMVNLVRNLKNSLAGLRAACADRSFRAELALGVVLMPAVALSPGSPGLKLGVFATYGLLLAFELINTALERLCDLVTLEQHPTIKAVKDMASGAVFLVLLMLLGGATVAFVGAPEF